MLDKYWNETWMTCWWSNHRLKFIAELSAEMYFHCCRMLSHPRSRRLIVSKANNFYRNDDAAQYAAILWHLGHSPLMRIIALVSKFQKQGISEIILNSHWKAAMAFSLASTATTTFLDFVEDITSASQFDSLPQYPNHRSFLSTTCEMKSCSVLYICLSHYEVMHLGCPLSLETPNSHSWPFDHQVFKLPWIPVSRKILSWVGLGRRNQEMKDTFSVLWSRVWLN